MAGENAGKGGLLHWKGLFATSDKASRIAGIGAIAVGCIAMVATQLNYVIAGDAHMITVLAPITACALLYGTLPATLVGALAGLAELIHANLLPLDYYEMYFSAPWNSVMLFALAGLVLGMLYALVDRRPELTGWRRPVSLVVACLITSSFFTLFFTLSASIISSIISLEVPHGLLAQLTGTYEAFSQWLGNFGLMTIFMLIADSVAARNVGQERNHTIRQTFQGWLGVVVALSYMVCAAFAYTGISAICRGDAEQQMASQIQHLEDQLAERDSMLEGIQRRTSATDSVLQEVHLSSIGSVADSAVIGEDGVAIVAEDGVVASSNVDAYVGKGFEEVVGSGLREAFSDALYDASRSTQWDMGDGTLGFARVARMGYARLAQVGDYQLMVAMSAADVFGYRTLLMVVVSIIFVGIFAALYVQAALLLQNVVVRGFDQTNATLALITEGDLDQVVDVTDTLEFSDLSSGINATVGALKESIAAEAARLDRELKTARAIQESALPSTYRPFPDIDRFDIYASMDAAKEVGGDFYDFFLIDEHRLGFLIADVSGKGIPASLFMMAAKTELANYVGTGMDLAQAVQSANYHLCQGNEAGMFVTVWVAVLDYETGELTYVNAGHNPPLLRHAGEWHWLREKGGLFLGTFESARYRSCTIQLEEGDEILLYTDGVNEAFSADEEQYGEERLERFLSQHLTEHAHALAIELRSEIAHWAAGAEQSDDITMLVLEYGVAPEVTRSITLPAVLPSLEEALEFIHGELSRRYCPIETQNQIDIAFEELFVNVCNYAYKGADGPGKVRVDYLYNSNPDSITVQITDWGVAFDPLGHDDPSAPESAAEAKIGGLGILMTKRLTDDISYLRDDDKNVVAFKKGW